MIVSPGVNAPGNLPIRYVGVKHQTGMPNPLARGAVLRNPATTSFLRTTGCFPVLPELNGSPPISGVPKDAAHRGRTDAMRSDSVRTL
jgi:hypothetical protein